jgi:uncharacterized protein (TIGR02996 family)
MREREVPEPLVVEPWWRRFGATALSLLRQIAQRPLDPLPRLILADFLEENGAPARAEFIRLQVAEMNNRWGWENERSWLRREMELWMLFRVQWRKGLPELRWRVWGGLIEGLVAQSIAALQEAQRHLDVRWVWWRGPVVELLRRLDLLVGVIGLAILGLRLGDAALARLARSTFFQNLMVLNLWNNAIGVPGVAALAQSSCFQNLTTLILWNNEIGDAGVQELLMSPYLQNLTIVHLGNTGLSDAGVRALAASTFPSNLTVLMLGQNRIRDAGAAALAACPYLRRLSTLDLSHNQIGDAGAAALAESPFLQSLTMLDLRQNPISAAGRELLRQSPYLRRCRVRL